MHKIILISPIEKVMELRLGKAALVIWKTYRWHAVLHAGHHRLVIL